MERPPLEWEDPEAGTGRALVRVEGPTRWAGRPDATLLAALAGDQGDPPLGVVLGGPAATALAVSRGPPAIEILRESRLTWSLEEAVEM